VRLLVMAGFDASLHHCGQDALDAIPATRPALVILDVDMPSMDGLECLRSIRARHGADRLPVVMYSGDFVYERVSEAKRLGAQEYIVKGAMQWPEFLEIIQRHVAARGPDAEPPTEQAAV
jgi:PleD family two-component response regulator